MKYKTYILLLVIFEYVYIKRSSDFVNIDICLLIRIYSLFFCIKNNSFRLEINIKRKTCVAITNFSIKKFEDLFVFDVILQISTARIN
jgi:hypothetical protein